MALGLDLGSQRVKAVVVDEGRITQRKCWGTIDFFNHYLKKRGDVLHLVNFPYREERVGLTGYGSTFLKVAQGRKITEITAHVKGTMHFWGRKLTDFTLLDVGGQDIKIIKVKDGKVIDFLTNDRCAASSGSFLQHMANFLKVDLSFLMNQYEDPVELNTTCSVFAETEIIEKISCGVSLESLCAGINQALYLRIKPFLLRLPSKVVILSGGGGNNPALAHFIKGELKLKVEVNPYSEYTGALGCALLAEEGQS